MVGCCVILIVGVDIVLSCTGANEGDAGEMLAWASVSEDSPFFHEAVVRNIPFKVIKLNH